MMTLFATIGAVALIIILVAIAAGALMQIYDDDPDWML